MNIDEILEIFGVNGSTNVRVGECTSDLDLPLYITVTPKNRTYASVVISCSEARYLSDRLKYLADKVAAKKVRRGCS